MVPNDDWMTKRIGRVFRWRQAHLIYDCGLLTTHHAAPAGRFAGGFCPESPQGCASLSPATRCRSMAPIGYSRPFPMRSAKPSASPRIIIRHCSRCGRAKMTLNPRRSSRRGVITRAQLKPRFCAAAMPRFWPSGSRVSRRPAEQKAVQVLEVFTDVWAPARECWPGGRSYSTLG